MCGSLDNAVHEISRRNGDAHCNTQNESLSWKCIGESRSEVYDPPPNWHMQ